MDLKNQRQDYHTKVLLEEEIGMNPFELFTAWFLEANQVEAEANAFTIATSMNNRPQARTVLLKELTNDCFVFFTNYHSTKGRSIESNPNVSMLFFWQKLERQIRIEGVASKTSATYSDEYFYSRPIESQIGAIASTQSAELNERYVLEDRIKELTAFYKTNPIIRPENWGGFAIKPSYFEFWQGRASRLHDRIVYEVNGDSWKRGRLYP
jgi:pyridoxamine 5'-phosphate oxidase